MNNNTLGGYRLLEQIGEGGMGTVYLGQALASSHPHYGVPVAIKVLHAHLARHAGLRTRFEREASLAEGLAHPNIVRVLEVFEDQGRVGMVMERVQGLPLNAWPQLSDPEVWSVVTQIGQALSAVHAQGIVHRDLKRENVMRADNGHVVLLDFGIAKGERSNGTKTGTAMGTVSTMAPEQYINAKGVDQRADIYALALVSYELLTGTQPWPSGLSEFEVLTRKADGDLTPLAEQRPDLPPALGQVLATGLSADPASRFASVAAFLTALDFAGAALPTQAPPRPSAPLAPVPVHAMAGPSAPTLAPLEDGPGPTASQAEAPSQPAPSSPPAPASSPRRTGWWLLALPLTGLACSGLCAGCLALNETSVLDTHELTLVQVEAGPVALGTQAVPTRITHSYEIGATEVNQALWAELMPLQPCTHGCGPDLPVHGVSWYDAVAFCNALSEAEGLEPAYTIEGGQVRWDRGSEGFRLPTEAEWERAAHAGEDLRYAGSDTAAEVAWYGEGRWQRDWKRAPKANAGNAVHASASLAPNAWGLYDMSGNVVEWVWDWEGPVDPKQPLVDPVGPTTGEKRLAKGGSFQMADRYAQISRRAAHEPESGTPAFGFRIARGATSP